jgi:hypothetical protein
MIRQDDAENSPAAGETDHPRDSDLLMLPSRKSDGLILHVQDVQFSRGGSYTISDDLSYHPLDALPLIAITD